MKAVLKENQKRCDNCQRYSSGTIHFKFEMPHKSDLVFGDVLSIGLTFLDGNDVLNIADTVPEFSAATFLDSNGDNMDNP